MPCDYSKYPVNWKTEIRPRIMARANNCCEVEGCEFEHMTYAWSLNLGKGQQRQWFKYSKSGIQVAMDSGMTYEKAWQHMRQILVVITIAHLDHDEENMDIQDDRLQAMCQLHHLRYDAEEKAKRKRMCPKCKSETILSNSGCVNIYCGSNKF